MDLIREDIERGNWASAHKNLLLQLAAVRQEDFQTVYQHLFILLDQIDGPAFSQLEERLVETPLLKESSHLAEEQKFLALSLGRALLRTREASMTHRLLAMEYYAVTFQIATRDGEAASHQAASHLLLQTCLDSLSFEEQIQEAKKSPEAFGQLIERVGVLGKTFCCTPADAAIIKKFYEILRDALTSIRVDRAGPYRGCFLQLQSLLPNPPHTPGGTYPTARYQEELDKVRKPFAFIPEDLRDVRGFQAEMTQNFRAFFKELEKDLLLLLGPPPCGYQLCAMGSLGREEPCPFSDVELLVLIEREDANVLKYFTRMIHFLDLQLRALGETHTIPLVFPAATTRIGLQIDTAGNPAAISELMGSPSSFALLQQKELHPDPEFGTLKTPQHTALTSTRPLQEGPLFDPYRRSLQAALQRETNGLPLSKRRALDYLRTMLKNFSSLCQTPYSLSEIDLKEAAIAPLYYSLAQLALYFEIEETNTLDIVDALGRKGVFSPATTEMLKTFVATLYTLRVQTHLDHRQKKDIFIAGPGRPQNFLVEKIYFRALRQIYWLALRPLYRSLNKALSPEHLQFETVFTQLDLMEVAFEEICQSSEAGGVGPVIQGIVSSLKNKRAATAEYLPYFRRLSSQSRLEPFRELFLEEAKGAPECEPLYHIPNRAGMRFSFSRNYGQLQASLFRLTDKDPTPGAPVQIKVVSSLFANGSRYLNPQSHPPLDPAGNFLRDKGSHAHAVVRIDDLYFKQEPGNPLMEYAVHNLFHRLGGDLTPPNQLVRFEVTHQKTGKPIAYPVLISQAIPGQTLKEVFLKLPKWPPLNLAQLTWLLLGSVLTRPGDGHLSNYVLNQKDLFCVDNDISFVEPISRPVIGSKQIHICSALFFFPGPLDRDVLHEFVSLDVDTLLDGWIEEVIQTEQKYLRLFTEEERKYFYDKDPKNRITFTILFKEGALATLNLQFWQLQQYLKERLRQELPVTAFDLLSQLISIQDTRESTIGPLVSDGYSKTTGPLEERLKQAVGRKTDQSLTSAQYHEKVFKRIPTWEEIHRKQRFSPLKAREELLQVLVNCPGVFHIAEHSSAKTSLEADFGKLPEDETRQSLVLKALQFWATQQNYTSIALRKCIVLDSDTLAPFLQPTVEQLDLSYCPRIRGTDVIQIKSQCPRLKELFLDGCILLRTIDDGGFFRGGPIRFESLQSLSLNECSELNSVQIASPLLRSLQAKNTHALLRMELITQSFPCIDIQGSSCKDVELRPLTEICKTQKDFENAERFYSTNEEVARVTVRKEPMVGWLKKGLCFGASKWKEYFGVDVVEPPLPPDIVRILVSPCPFWPEKAVFETHLGPILVPAGMTLEGLEGLVQNSKKGNKIGFRYKSVEPWAQHSKTPIERTHWVLMTKNALEGTYQKGWKHSEAQLPSVRAKGYDLPSGVEAGAALFLTYVQTGERYYTDSPWTGTYCSEQVRVSGTWPMVVGGFAPAGLCVYYADDYHYYYYSHRSYYCGLGCLRKFF